MVNMQAQVLFLCYEVSHSLDYLGTRNVDAFLQPNDFTVVLNTKFGFFHPQGCVIIFF